MMDGCIVGLVVIGKTMLPKLPKGTWMLSSIQVVEGSEGMMVFSLWD